MVYKFNVSFDHTLELMAAIMQDPKLAPMTFQVDQQPSRKDTDVFSILFPDQLEDAHLDQLCALSAHHARIIDRKPPLFTQFLYKVPKDLQDKFLSRANEKFLMARCWVRKVNDEYCGIYFRSDEPQQHVYKLVFLCGHILAETISGQLIEGLDEMFGVKK